MSRTLLFVLCGLIGCNDKGGGDSGDLDPDLALAAELWEAISGYSLWTQHPDFMGIQESADGTHGDYVQVWYDTSAEAAFLAGTEIPDGSILVKQGYSDAEGSELLNLTVMWKIDGYDPDNADWFWARYVPDTGEVTLAGAETACSGCHKSLDVDNDLVLFLE